VTRKFKKKGKVRVVGNATNEKLGLKGRLCTELAEHVEVSSLLEVLSGLIALVRGRIAAARAAAQAPLGVLLELACFAPAGLLVLHGDQINSNATEDITTKATQQIMTGNKRMVKGRQENEGV